MLAAGSKGKLIRALLDGDLFAWGIVVVVALVVGIGYVFVMREGRRKEQVTERLARDLTDELGSEVRSVGLLTLEYRGTQYRFHERYWTTKNPTQDEGYSQIRAYVAQGLRDETGAEAKEMLKNSAVSSRA